MIGRPATRRDFLRSVGLGAAATALPRWARGAPGEAPDKPNFVIIFTDDQGYQDVGCFGSPDIRTPHLDRMAAEGMKFTDFYVAAPVCSASRAALMTGCYPQRVGGLGALFPDSPKDASMGKTGLHPDEITIAELLKPQGYATACVGKWHLGHRTPFLATRQGFDYYFGIPYSNDMYPGAGAWQKQTGWPALPLMEKEKTIETNPDQGLLTKRYTAKSVEFITKNKDRPFLLYLAHSMPHTPLAASKDFRGKSRRGLYGDVVEEIDWSVGQILQTLRKLKIDRRTLVIFTSDNGPWLIRNEHGGSAGPLRDGKWSLYEGGLRVPCIMWWPGRVPAGKVCAEIASTMDLLPTLAHLAGTKAPGDRKIDGKDIGPLLSGRAGARTPHEAFFYGTSAVRCGKWKLHLARDQDTQCLKNRRGRYVKRVLKTPVQLYDLSSDIGETRNVADKHPEVVQRLTKRIAAHKKDLQANARPAGKIQ